MKTINLEEKTIELINDFKKIHKDKYDYSHVFYTGSMDDVTIICPEHGVFKKKPFNHKSGSGCPKCTKNKKLKETQKIFIQRSKKIHKDKYDYTKVDYKGSHAYVTIICPVHGEFKQRPSSHLNGQGCKKCSSAKRAKKNSMTKKEFIERAKKVHGDKYGYNYVHYKNSYSKVIISCKIHGKFTQSPSNHLSGQGCMHCRKSKGTLGTDEFIRRSNIVHNNAYDYSDTVYTYASKKVKIKCQKHGIFEQTAYSHLQGTGCPTCGYEKRSENRKKNDVVNKKTNGLFPKDFKIK